MNFSFQSKIKIPQLLGYLDFIPSQFLLLILGIFLATGMGCKPKTKENKPAANFDRQLMLSQLADGYILPYSNSFSIASDSLNWAAQNYASNSSSSNLALLQNQWVKTYDAFLSVYSLNFGPGEKPIVGTLAENVGIWPVNKNRIEEKVAMSLTDFSQDFERDTRGLLALDYLLFDSISITKFTIGADTLKRRTYLLALTNHVKTWANDLSSGWIGYRNAFVNNNGKDAGSSISMFYNTFLLGYEVLKNYKIALPAGKRVGQTQIEPSLVEAYYSQQSLHFLQTHLTAITHLWFNISSQGANQSGFDDWLSSLSDGPPLKTQTETQFIALSQKVQDLQIGLPLSNRLQQDPACLDNLYATCQQTTRLLKSDLSSLIGIAITYTSGDGD